MALPPGLTPVEAGRIGLWLLGKRKQRQAQAARESAFFLRAFGPSFAGRFCAIVTPWKMGSYMRGEFLLARLCAVSERRAEAWLSTRLMLPARHARTMADYVERFDGVGLARELRAYADERDAKIGSRATRAAKQTRDKGKFSR